MKNRRIRFVIVLVVILAVIGPQPVLGGPPILPSSFYGTVQMNQANVPAGTMVTALINGVEYAHAVVSIYQGVSVASLDVPADDPGSPAKEGGVTGDVVNFRVGNQMMMQKAPWRGGVNLHLDLMLYHACLPSVSRSAGH